MEQHVKHKAHRSTAVFVLVRCRLCHTFCLADTSWRNVLKLCFFFAQALIRSTITIFKVHNTNFQKLQNVLPRLRCMLLSVLVEFLFVCVFMNSYHAGKWNITISAPFRLKSRHFRFVQYFVCESAHIAHEIDMLWYAYWKQMALFLLYVSEVAHHIFHKPRTLFDVIFTHFLFPFRHWCSSASVLASWCAPVLFIMVVPRPAAFSQPSFSPKYLHIFSFRPIKSTLEPWQGKFSSLLVLKMCAVSYARTHFSTYYIHFKSLKGLRGLFSLAAAGVYKKQNSVILWSFSRKLHFPINIVSSLPTRFRTKKQTVPQPIWCNQSLPKACGFFRSSKPLSACARPSVQPE